MTPTLNMLKNQLRGDKSPKTMELGSDKSEIPRSLILDDQLIYTLFRGSGEAGDVFLK